MEARCVRPRRPRIIMIQKYDIIKYDTKMGPDGPTALKIAEDCNNRPMERGNNM